IIVTWMRCPRTMPGGPSTLAVAGGNIYPGRDRQTDPGGHAKPIIVTWMRGPLAQKCPPLTPLSPYRDFQRDSCASKPTSQADSYTGFYTRRAAILQARDSRVADAKCACYFGQCLAGLSPFPRLLPLV